MTDNPFQQIDKKSFPAKRRPERSAPPGRRPGVPSRPDRGQSREDDNAAFLEAMDGITPFVPLHTAARAEATGSAPPARPLRSPDGPPPGKDGDCPPAGSEARVPGDRQEAEESADFAEAMRNVKPLPGGGRELPAELPARTPPPPGNPLLDFMEGKVEFALQHTKEYMEGHVLGLDMLTIGKLRAGQLSPEGHLDLHGCNALQAYHNLIVFIRNAYLRSWRTVLVVSGRGINSPNGIPVLREKIQTWLTQ
jgi:DNA-nicking Smr family endonuclease